MDYREAIKEAESQINMYEAFILYNRDFEPKNNNSNYEFKIDFLKTAISVMQELQEYHKTGLSAKQVSDNIHELSATKRVLGHYQQIGTLEECKEAIERRRPKNPDDHCSCTEKTHYKCPYCGYIMLTVYASGYRLGNQTNCCDKCGQAIDWSDKE